MSTRPFPVDPFDIVVFGGTGDLSRRKLMPSLYYRDRDGQIPAEARIIGTSRSETGREAYAREIEQAIREHVPAEHIEDTALRRFLARIDHVTLDAKSATGWKALSECLSAHQERIRVYYMATAPDLFGPLCAHLAKTDLITKKSRVVLEKPIGHDLESAKDINDCVGAVFEEEQIFRIDHYLGKEAVQNLMVLRFANLLFEPLWNSSRIDHVQITVAEHIGVEGRGSYYDRSGALRDMVQNHMLQLVCLAAMEPPGAFNAAAVRDEKLKVLRALKPFTGADRDQRIVRGQYRAGAVNGKAVPGYLEEIGSRASSTETFVALKAEIENWRWAGVPFYLRTGKRLATHASEIVIQFRDVPYSIFNDEAGALAPNRLIVRLQPDEGVKLVMMTKNPAPGGLRVRQAPLNLSFADTFKVRFPGAYERLLMDVVRGDATLFMSRNEVEAAWAWIEPIIDAWAAQPEPPKPYSAGSWGPSAAIALIERDGRTWWDDDK
jgi:glucose-6-phosphate 1-dehydrogenase